MDVWKEVERGLGSEGKIRILRKMLEKPNMVFSKYALKTATGLKWENVKSDVKILTELGWLKKNAYDPETYKVNMENEFVQHIAEFFKRVSLVGVAVRIGEARSW